VEGLADFCRVEHPRLVGLLSLYCRDRRIAEELAQEAMIRVISDWSPVRELNSPSGWAYRVAINLANSYFRRRLAEHRATRRIPPGTIKHEPDTSTALAVRQAVASLPQRERAVVVLRFFADLSVREVSVLLGYPEGTVKTLTARALVALHRSGLNEIEEVTDGR
jgi:RNA polymerase sigma-70 factor (ECF subfamily)